MQMSVLTFLLSRHWNAKKINLFSILSISIVRGRGRAGGGLIVEERKCLVRTQKSEGTIFQILCSRAVVKGWRASLWSFQLWDAKNKVLTTPPYYYSSSLSLLSQVPAPPGPAQPAAQSWIWAKSWSWPGPLWLQLQPSFPLWCQGRVGPGHQSLTLGGKYQTWSSTAAR